MIQKKLPNAASSTITVTSTATLLTDLMDTAGSVTTNSSVKADVILISNEDEDVRILLDGNVPTAANGELIPANTMATFEGVVLAKVYLIRAGGTNSTCSLSLSSNI